MIRNEIAVDPELQFHAAQLLRDVPGTQRHATFATAVLPLEEGRTATGVTGSARFMRTNRGILASVTASMTMTMPCSRCLADVTAEVGCRFEEEYLPVIDVTTGAPAQVEDDPDAFRIDEHHVLDFSEALRQYALMVEPMAPLCTEMCKGLCPRCGVNRNEQSCGCLPPIDPRWAGLEVLVEGTTREVR